MAERGRGCGGGERVEERAELRWILVARRGLRPACGVDRVRPGRLHARGDVLAGQAAAQDQRDPRAALCDQTPVECLPCAAAHPLPARGPRAGVEQVKVDVEPFEVPDVGGPGDLGGLDDPRPGAPRDLAAERRSLVAVELHERQPELLGDLDDARQRCVDEHAAQLDAASQRCADTPACSSEQLRGLAHRSSARSPMRRAPRTARRPACS